MNVAHGQGDEQRDYLILGVERDFRKQAFGKLEQRLAELKAELRLDFRTEFTQVRIEIQQLRTELIRWMFGFWVTTLLALAGMVVTLR